METLSFIQIGANDGFNNDPLHKYIKRDNWSGVLLEPQSWVFNKYLQKLHAKSPKIHTINAAIDDSDGYQSLFKIGFSTARWATGLASFNKTVLEKAFVSGYVEQKAKKEGISIPMEKQKQIIEEKIRTISFTSLIKDYQITNLDLLAIDTEGFDFEVIKMFDFDKIVPRVIIFEPIHLPSTDKIACYNFLKRQGYTIWDEGANAIAMLEPSPLFVSFFE